MENEKQEIGGWSTGMNRRWQSGVARDNVQSSGRVGVASEFQNRNPNPKDTET